MASGQTTSADLSDMAQRAGLVRDLMEHPGWAAFEALIEESQKLKMRMLLNGKATDNASEYAKALGELRGLGFAPSLAKQFVNNGLAAAAELRSQTESAAEEAVG